MKAGHTWFSAALALALALGLVGCRDTLPCTDCDEAADDQDDAPTPDLPCGGADLMTDNLNCGSCGKECGLWYAGTEWEAGSCVEGECSPGGWAGCVHDAIPDPFANCAEICTALGQSCLPQGCAGATALVFEIGFEDTCDAWSFDPAVVMTGSCEEPIPWLTTDEYSHEVSCCCDFQS